MKIVNKFKQLWEQLKKVPSLIFICLINIVLHFREWWYGPFSVHPETAKILTYSNSNFYDRVIKGIKAEKQDGVKFGGPIKDYPIEKTPRNYIAEFCCIIASFAVLLVMFSYLMLTWNDLKFVIF